MSEKYNGWTNYETWLCKLWQDNDGDSYYVEMAETAYNESFADGPFSKDENASFLLADMLKEHWEQHLEEMLNTQSGFIVDLVNAGISAVNWQEIARSYIDNLEIEAAA